MNYASEANTPKLSQLLFIWQKIDACPASVLYTNITMYRITYSKELSEQWRKTQSVTNLEPNTRRIYRWGTMWGVMAAETWSCESRTSLQDSPSFLVELYTPIRCDILPNQLDDVWEEEYFSISTQIEYNGHLIIKGGRDDVLKIVEQLGLPIPSLPPLSYRNSMEESVATMFASRKDAKSGRSFISQKHGFPAKLKPKPKPTPKCFIQD
jgi:hypothetical protein